MKPNTLMVVLALLALVLSGARASSSSSSSSSSAAAPVIEFVSRYKNRVSVECGRSYARIKDVELDPGQSYSIKVDVKNKHVDDYDCSVFDGSMMVEEQAYDPARDKGHMKIYWKINKVGLYRSYDKVHWVFDDEWSSVE